MYISEIAANTDIKISVTIGTEKLEFTTKAVYIEDKGLDKVRSHFVSAVAEPVRVDDKLVALRMGVGIVYSVQAFNAQEEKMYEWINVKPQMITLKDGRKFLLLVCKDNMKPLNRRRSFRLWLGADGVATLGLDKKPLDIVVKDISSGGIAFIAKDFGQKLLPNTLAHVSFFDEDTETNFNINAIILRTEELAESRVLFACKLSMESLVVNKFIKEKERINLRKRSNLFSQKRQQDYTS